MSSISKNLSSISSKLNTNVKLLAVSKTRPESQIIEAINWGQKDFGENKVQDLEIKSKSLSELNINWHFIGHLQSNKINQILKVKNLVSIHSIDSIKLLNKLLAKKIDTKIGIFLQVNTSGEEEKGGFRDEGELEMAVKSFKDSTHFYLQGLMTIGKIRTNEFESDAKESFSKLANLKEKLDETYNLDLELSMGMSQDFEIAQDYGSNWVRVGSDIFGVRS